MNHTGDHVYIAHNKFDFYIVILAIDIAIRDDKIFT